MNHQRDRDVIGATDTVEMVLDVAEHEADLVAIVEMIDYLQFCRRCFDRSVCARGGKGGAERPNRAPQHIASMHDVLSA